MKKNEMKYHERLFDGGFRFGRQEHWRKCCLCNKEISVKHQSIVPLVWKHLEEKHPEIAIELLASGYNKRWTPWII